MSGGMSQLCGASTIRELDDAKLIKGIWRKRKIDLRASINLPTASGNQRNAT
jgi:hypothetical protein